MDENSIFEKKSLSTVSSKNSDFKELAKDCVGLANSAIHEIHQRIGSEIPLRRLRTCIYNAVKTEEIKCSGSKKFRKYFIDKNEGE